MTTCSNKKKEKPLKKTKQAIEIIIDVLVQEQRTNSFFKNVDLEFVRASLKEDHENHYPTYRDQKKFRGSVEKFLRDEQANFTNDDHLITSLDRFFSKSSKLEKIAKKMSKYYQILLVPISVLTLISLILTLSKIRSTVSFQQNLSSSLETNKAPKHILQVRK